MPATSPPRIRALFIDIDGTLVGADDRISSADRTALTAAREQGCEIVLCTGRTRYTAQPIAEQIAPPLGYAIMSNGGVVMHLGTEEVLRRHLLPIPTALDIVRAIVAAGAEPYVFEDAIAPGIESARVLHHPDLPVGHWAVRPRYRPHATLMEDLPFAPVSVSAYGPPQRMRPLVHDLRARLSDTLSIIQSGSENIWGIEIFVANVSKGRGLEVVAEHLGIAREETLAIGDHINDLEMLEWAGVGIAMGNALPEVQAIADWITTTQAEAGVARAIARYVLARQS
jgi:Cof subfamily protein (haloacid dehalogenase superfamily)